MAVPSANVARSSGEAELSSAANGISEGLGVMSAIGEVVGEHRSTIFGVDANECKRAVAPHWVLGGWNASARDSSGYKVRFRAASGKCRGASRRNASDILTPSGGVLLWSVWNIRDVMRCWQTSAGHYVPRA